MVVEEEPSQTIPAWMFFYCSLLLADVFCERFLEQPGAGLISQNEMLA